jgi:hypothetical protein
VKNKPALFEDTEPLALYSPMHRNHSGRIEYILWDGRLRSDRLYYPFDHAFMKLDEAELGKGKVTIGGMN